MLGKHCDSDICRCRVRADRIEMAYNYLPHIFNSQTAMAPSTQSHWLSEYTTLVFGLAVLKPSSCAVSIICLRASGGHICICVHDHALLHVVCMNTYMIYVSTIAVWMQPRAQTRSNPRPMYIIDPYDGHTHNELLFTVYQLIYTTQPGIMFELYQTRTMIEIPLQTQVMTECARCTCRNVTFWHAFTVILQHCISTAIS